MNGNGWRKVRNIAKFFSTCSRTAFSIEVARPSPICLVFKKVCRAEIEPIPPTSPCRRLLEKDFRVRAKYHRFDCCLIIFSASEITRHSFHFNIWTERNLLNDVYWSRYFVLHPQLQSAKLLLAVLCRQSDRKHYRKKSPRG